MKLALLALVLAAACGKKSEPEADHDIAETARRGVSWLVDKADEEKQESDAQTRRVAKAVADVQQAIEDNDLDRAESRLADVYWEPDPTRSMLSDTTKKLIEQTDQKRELLRGVIERKRR